MTATAVLLVMTIIHAGGTGDFNFIYMITIGMTLTSTFTLAMEKQGHRAGSASALLGMLPLLLGSIVSPLVGMNEATCRWGQLCSRHPLSVPSLFRLNNKTGESKKE